MPHEFLNDFLSKLPEPSELVRITASVDAGLEVAAITDQVYKIPGGGPALVFSNVKNSSIPLITNLLGSERRLCLALGVESLAEIADKLNRLRQPQPESGGWLETLRLVSPTTGLARFAPRQIKTAVCQQVVKLGRDVNLWTLPIPRCWPEETNPVITAGLVVTRDLESGSRGLARFPVQVVNQTKLIPHWHRYHAAFHQWQEAVRSQRQFPIAIALGGDPVQAMMSVAPPLGVDPILLTGYLRGAGLDMVRARSVELEVPAASEIVVEGYIDYTAPLIEAPSIAGGNGQYLPTEALPTIEVTAVTHRANPILPVMIPGPLASEEQWIGRAWERLSLSLIKSVVPEIVDIHHPFSGAGHNLLFASVHKCYGMQARQILNAIWGSPLLGQRKMTIVVDSDIDLHSEQDVWSAVMTNSDLASDLIVHDGPISMDDQTNLRRGVGRKIGIDATRKFPEESHGRSQPRRLVMSRDMINRIQQRWNELGMKPIP